MRGYFLANARFNWFRVEFNWFRLDFNWFSLKFNLFRSDLTGLGLKFTGLVFVLFYDFCYFVLFRVCFVLLRFSVISGAVRERLINLFRRDLISLGLNLIGLGLI